jgi:hypothetical protein
VRGVALASGEIVEGDAVVIAMGPWSILAARWLPLPAVHGYKGHSLVFETGGAIPVEALFLELGSLSLVSCSHSLAAQMVRAALPVYLMTPDEARDCGEYRHAAGAVSAPSHQTHKVGFFRTGRYLRGCAILHPAPAASAGPALPSLRTHGPGKCAAFAYRRFARCE